MYPIDTTMLTHAKAAGGVVLRGHVQHYQVTVKAASTTGVLAAQTDTGAPVTITEGLTSPDVPRTITATAGGTAGNIAAIQVTVVGTNMAGETITEDLPAFTVDTAGTVVGSKAFATVTSVTIPAHDGTAATTSIGWGDKLGLPDKLPHDTVLMAFHDNTREGTAPTVATSATDLESNTCDLDTTLVDDKVVDVYYVT
jgi:hypothetical protein